MPLLWSVEVLGRAETVSAETLWRELPLWTDEEVERVFSSRTVPEGAGLSLHARLLLRASDEAAADMTARRFVERATQTSVSVLGLSAQTAPAGWRDAREPDGLQPVEEFEAYRVVDEDDRLELDFEAYGEVARLVVDEDEAEESVVVRLWAGHVTPNLDEVTWGYGSTPSPRIVVRLASPLGHRSIVDGHTGAAKFLKSPNRYSRRYPSRPVSRRDFFRIC